VWNAKTAGTRRRLWVVGTRRRERMPAGSPPSKHHDARSAPLRARQPRKSEITEKERQSIDHRAAVWWKERRSIPSTIENFGQTWAGPVGQLGRRGLPGLCNMLLSPTRLPRGSTSLESTTAVRICREASGGLCFICCFRWLFRAFFLLERAAGSEFDRGLRNGSRAASSPGRSEARAPGRISWW
jgi:hypothetical protein